MSLTNQVPLTHLFVAVTVHITSKWTVCSLLNGKTQLALNAMYLSCICVPSPQKWKTWAFMLRSNLSQWFSTTWICRSLEFLCYSGNFAVSVTCSNFMYLTWDIVYANLLFFTNSLEFTNPPLLELLWLKNTDLVNALPICWVTLPFKYHIIFSPSF